MDYAFKYVSDMMNDLFDIVLALMLIVPSEIISFLFKRIQTDFPFIY